MKIRKYITYRNLLIAYLIAEIVSFLSVLISPKYFWPLGLINYGIPFLLFFNFILLIWLIIKRDRLWWAVLAVILSSYYLLDVTYNFPTWNSADKENTFKVLSFNAKLFRHRRDYGKFSMECINWALNEDAEIKCFQEYSTNPDIDSIDVTSKFEAKGYYSFTRSYPLPDINNHHGMAIFSKFPIVNSGEIDLNGVSINNCIYVDVVIGNDTVRVYNYHLNSMGLKLRMYKNPNDFHVKMEYLLKKLGRSSAKRGKEIDLMMEAFDACPYPKIVVGDFNELPYGNNYYRMTRKFNNTFEEMGDGFGFTFNSILFFLRIDHQFYSDDFQSERFDVLRKVKYSDHFPVEGSYILK